MKKPSDIIKRLEADNSRLAKEAILTEVMTNAIDLSNGIFIAGAMRAFDTYETFGIKKVPLVNHSNSENMSTEFAYFDDMLDVFADRTITGNMAIELIDKISNFVNAEDWNYFYSRVLQKNLKCGVNVSTWNNVAKRINPHLIVPVFTCQFAHDGSKTEPTGDKLVEVKLDGVRVITIVKADGTVSMHSRNGKPLDNFPKIAESFKKLAPYLVCDLVLDGEVMSSSFQDLMKQVHRKSDVQTDDAILYLFDCLPLADFKDGEHKIKQCERSRALIDLVQMIREDNVCVVAQELVKLDTVEGKARLQEINRMAIENEYEGVMLKDPLAPYECKRTKSWLKIKPTIEVTLDVKKVNEGTGKYVGTTGALVCEGTDTGRKISVNVGSGLSDTLRDDIWGNLNQVIGSKVEVIADAITQNQDGTYSLRFPRFKTFRGFVPGEKI